MTFVKFDEGVLLRIAKLINIHFSLPILYDLSGGNFESFFAEAIDGKRETKKRLFDVTKGDIGWSLKTLQTTSDEKFELVLKRCDVIKRDFAWQTENAQIIGDTVIQSFADFYEKSLVDQRVSEPRIAIMLVHKKALRFRVFQMGMKMYLREEIIWEFSRLDKEDKEKSEIKSIIGKVDGKAVYRWYRSGTQLFGIYDLPKEAITYEFRAEPRLIEMAILEKAFDSAPVRSAQSIRQQVVLLNSQLDDTENDKIL
jgi:hypothetical protein